MLKEPGSWVQEIALLGFPAVGVTMIPFLVVIVRAPCSGERLMAFQLWTLIRSLPHFQVTWTLHALLLCRERLVYML